MKEIVKREPEYLEKYDIHVNPYLTYAQIQQIIDAVKAFDVYTERAQNIDMLVLFHATDMGRENIEKYDHDTLLCSGLIDAVKSRVLNLYLVDEGIEYTESTQRAVAQILKQLPETVKPLQEVMKKYGNFNTIGRGVAEGNSK